MLGLNPPKPGNLTAQAPPRVAENRPARRGGRQSAVAARRSAAAARQSLAAVCGSPRGAQHRSRWISSTWRPSTLRSFCPRSRASRSASTIRPAPRRRRDAPTRSRRPRGSGRGKPMKLDIVLREDGRHELDMLESGASQQLADCTLAQDEEMPVETVLQELYEEGVLPVAEVLVGRQGIEVRRLSVQDALRRQRRRAAPQGPDRVREVLEDVHHRDDIEAGGVERLLLDGTGQDRHLERFPRQRRDSRAQIEPGSLEAGGVEQAHEGAVRGPNLEDSRRRHAMVQQSPEPECAPLGQVQVCAVRECGKPGLPCVLVEVIEAVEARGFVDDLRGPGRGIPQN